MAFISYKNKWFRFQDPRGAVLCAKQGRLAVESKMLPSGTADLPGCCSAEPGHGADSSLPPLTASPGGVYHPILQGITGGRGKRQTPAVQSSVPFQSPQQSILQRTPQAGVSFKSLLLPKAHVGLILPAPSMSLVPRKVALLGG